MESPVRIDWKFHLALVAMIASVSLSEASGHEGPPFPILMDTALADYMVSVWADPDIGEARFFIIVESPEGGAPSQPPPGGIRMWIEPVSGRLDRVDVTVERQDLRNQLQYIARPFFDQQDEWNVGFQLLDRHGSAQELTTTVESTPPGYGVWDLAIYLFPFLIVAGFWAVAMVRRRERT